MPLLLVQYIKWKIKHVTISPHNIFELINCIWDLDKNMRSIGYPHCLSTCMSIINFIWPFLLKNKNFHKRLKLIIHKAQTMHESKANVNLSTSGQLYCPTHTKDTNRMIGTTFFIDYCVWILVPNSKQHMSAPFVRCSHLHRFHLYCVYCTAAATIFGTTDVYELGFSYLSISIFNPHSLKAIWEMRDWPPIHRIAQGSFSYGLRGHTQTSWGGGSHKTTAKHVTMLLEWIIKIIIYTLHIWITIEDHTLEFKMQNLYLVNLRCFFGEGGILPKKQLEGDGESIGYVRGWCMFLNLNAINWISFPYQLILKYQWSSING